MRNFKTLFLGNFDAILGFYFAWLPAFFLASSHLAGLQLTVLLSAVWLALKEDFFIRVWLK